MKQFIKNNLKVFVSIIITTIIVGSVSVYAATKYLASEINFTPRNADFKKENGEAITNVEEALNELYNNSNNAKKICKCISGTIGTLGSKYECDPGDGIKRNFFLLADNPGNVELIMEHNITEGTSKNAMIWADAMDYIETNNLKTSWKNVIDVNLPSVQSIANAVGNTDWDMPKKNYDGWFYLDEHGQTQTSNASNLSNYRWLFNYTRECANYGCDADASLGITEPSGYWTRDIVAVQKDSISRAWYVAMSGVVYINDLTSANHGVRPVITVLKSNLYSE